jgi:hypothetical protein
MDETELRSFSELSAPQACRVIEFEKAEVVTLESDPPQHLLTVSGTKPWLYMTVELMPLIYIRRPEYWGIEVVGCLKGISPAVLAPYQVSMNLSGVLGTKGIEVIGSNKREKIEIPAGEDCVGRFDLQIATPEGEVLASSTLTCGPAGGSHPNAEKACAQLSEADGDVSKIPAEDRICTREFKPVVLTAEGTWNSEKRSFKQQFGNRCEGVGDTGGVLFEFES